MGDWRFIVEGTGPCKNDDQRSDADELARDALAVFTDRGHALRNATFEYGGASESVTPRLEDDFDD